MKEEYKTRAQLIEENTRLRLRIEELTSQPPLQTKHEDEEAFINSELKLNYIINSIPVVLFAADQNGVFTLSEGKGLELLNIRRGERIGKSAFEVYKDINLIDRNGAKIPSDTAFKKILNGEMNFCRVEINGVLFETVFEILRDHKGNFKSIVGISLDISEKKQFEEALLFSETKFRSVVNSINDIVFLMDKSYKYVEVLGQYLNNNGIEHTELLGKQPEPDSIHYSAAREAFRGEGKKYDWVWDINGSRRYIQTHLTPMKDSNGDVISLLGVSRDITETRELELKLKEDNIKLEKIVKQRTGSLEKTNKLLQSEIKKLKKAEDKIADQYNLLRIIIDTIPNPVYMKDCSRRYIDCNKAFEKFHGVSREEVLGKTVNYLLDESTAFNINMRDEEMLRTGKQSTFQFSVKLAPGIERDLIVSKSLLKKADGSVIGFVGILVDITEIKKLHNDLQRTLDKEKELGELKSKFISTASHEFRTPLTSIRLFTDLIRLKFGEVSDEYTLSIYHAVDEMTALINDILSISKAESGGFNFNPEEINLYSLCQNVVAALSTAASHHTIKLNYQAASKYYRMDTLIIKHVLQNLINNAVKFSPEGSVVTINIESDKGKVNIKITDQGIGIPEGEVKHIFEPFYRARNSVRRPGTGLGLSIVKNFIDIHSGEISVETSENEGTTFTLSFNEKDVLI